MAEQTQAASSPAEVDVFRGETPTLAEYNAYRDKGEVPERFKPAESAGTAPDADESAEETPTADNSRERRRIRNAERSTNQEATR